jgi:diguanylate cyclase (GGDEF)-like protein/PAS domain S-box-containing protein
LTAQPYFLRDHRIISALLIAIVAVGVSLSFLLDWRSFEANMDLVARERGAALFRLIELTRSWNARHGGVYAPITDTNQPNPYLEHKQRDVVTQDGLALTLINPALMTRQIAEITRESNGFVIHITSNRPMRPDNRADAWEAAALERFERGLGETIEFIPGTAPVHRYMAPLRVAPPCMACHEKQGYQLGQIRGGISVTMPSSELLALRDAQRVRSAALHLLIFVVMSGLLLLLIMRARRHSLALTSSNVALAARKTLLKQILDTSSVAVFLVDMSGRITQANQRMAEMFGCTLDDLLGHEYVGLLPPAERETGRQKMLALLNCAIAAVDLDRLYWRADQSEFWGHLTGKRFYDADGQEFGLLGEIVDITVSKKAQAALKESEFLWKFAIEGSGDGVWDWNIVTDETAFSSNWKTMLGYDEDDILPRYQEWVKRVHPDDQARVADSMQAYLDGKTAVYVVEYRLCCKDGGYKWILARGMVVSRGDDEKPLRMIGTHTDISERKHMEEQIRQLAFHDTLTGLPNRRLLLDRLSQAMASSKRSGRYGAVMFLDLDNFKPLNDAHGHGLGDLLLIEVADRLCSCVRAMDTVARFGGDEFVVLLSDLDADRDVSAAQASRVAEKIRAILSAPYVLPVNHEGRAEAHVEHRCTVSIGAVLFIDNESSQDDILKRADVAMYQAKEAGRNTVRIC